MKKRTYALWVLLLFLVACTDSSDRKYLKLAHGLDVSHSVHKGMEFMAARLAEKSNGTLLIEIYPNQQLGTERQCLELLQIGSLAMTKVSAGVMENFAPNIEVLSLPYVFVGREHAYSVLDGKIGQSLLQQSEAFRLRGLTYFDAGQRSFYAKEPIRSPDDLLDKKIRVMESVTAMNLVRSMGGAPTPISWGELYTALQQGVVDGAENNPPSFYFSRHYEVCKYYTLNEHTAVPDILVMGTYAWNQLTEQEQIWVQEAANEAKAHQRKLWQASEQMALDSVKAAGVQVIIPDKSNFMEKTRALLDAYQDQPEKFRLIQEIQKLRPPADSLTNESAMLTSKP
ncbi:MAG: TRAP transporter substrate-binding protein [Bacteroidota bacterium]